MTKEQRCQKMKDAGIQPGSPAAKIFMRENETNEEAIERCAEELIASGQNVVPSGESQRVVPPGGPQSEPPIEQKMATFTDKEIKAELLKESIKQTEHLQSLSNNVKFFFYLTIISTLLYFLIPFYLS